MSAPNTSSSATSINAATRKPRPGGKAHRGHRALATLALLPFLAFLVLFAGYPLVELVLLSFNDTTVVGGQFVSVFNGIDNYVEALRNPTNLGSLGITVIFIVLTVGGTLFLGTLLALLVDRSVWMLGLARNVLIWPAVVTPVVVSVMWLLLLSPTVGGVNKVLLNLGLPTQAWLNSKVGAFLSVVVVDIWHWTPVVFLFVYTALRGLGQEVLEAARTDGATEMQTTTKIILPMLLPALAVVGAVRLVSSIKAFDEMYLLTRGGPDGATNLISLQIRTLFFDRLDFGPAAALSVSTVLFVALVMCAAVLSRRIRRGGTR